MSRRLQRAAFRYSFFRFWVAAAAFSSFLFFGSAAGASGDPAAGPALVMVAVDFGSPPSSQVPILYDDHHVYASPDLLRKKRVLAALVRSGAILVPLRNMFEAMGATVSVDPTGKTFTVQKSGASIQLTVGKNTAIINGELRRLDQGPIMYRGVALVPIRVISETMGAYVEWVPSRRVAVVRYIPPTPAPVPSPTPAPTPPPTPPPAPKLSHGFIQAGFGMGRNYNEFTDGQYCRNGTYVAAAAYMFGGSPIAVKVDFRQDAYVTTDNATDRLKNHLTRFATIDGGFAVTPVFLARQNTLDARLEFKLANPRIYAGVSYLQTSDNYGYPHLNGAGFGLEKLPDFHPGFNPFGSAFYYPSAAGDYTVTNRASSNAGKTYRQQYGILKYDVGLALVFHQYPVYVYGGFSGDRYNARQNAPIDQTHGGPYLGLGVKF